MDRPEGMYLDQTKIREAADFASAFLGTDGIARVRLAPGDMTEYPILIAAPGPEWAYRGDRYGYAEGDHYWVALCSTFGAGYFWQPQSHVSPGYAAEKWTHLGIRDVSRLWTGWVMADFLNAVSTTIRNNEAVRP
jgi:hypothetical protein